MADHSQAEIAFSGKSTPGPENLTDLPERTGISNQTEVFSQLDTAGTQNKFPGVGIDLRTSKWNGASTSRAVAVSADFRFFARDTRKPNGAEPTGPVEVDVLLLNGGRLLRTLRFQPDGKALPVTMLSFSNGGDILVGCLKDGESPLLVVWSVITGDVMKTIDPTKEAAREEKRRDPTKKDTPREKCRGTPGLEEPPITADAHRLLGVQIGGKVPKETDIFITTKEKLTIVVFDQEQHGNDKDKDSLPSVRFLGPKEEADEAHRKKHAQPLQGGEFLRRTLRLETGSEGQDSFWEKFEVVAMFEKDNAGTPQEHDTRQSAAMVSMVASVSKDKANIFCLIQKSGTPEPPAFTLHVFSLKAMTDLTKAVAGQNSSKDRLNTTTIPFNPLEPFMYRRQDDGPPVSLLQARVGKESRSWFSWVSGKVKGNDVASVTKKFCAKVGKEHLQPRLVAQPQLPIGEHETEGQPQLSENEHVVVQVFNPRDLKAKADCIFSLDEIKNHSKGTPKSRDRGLQDYALYLPSDKTVVLWNFKGELLKMFEHKRTVTCVDINKDASVIVVGVSGFAETHSGDPGTKVRKGISKVVLYSLHTFERLHTFPIRGDAKKATLEISAEARYIEVTFQDSPSTPGRIGLDEWVYLDSAGSKDLEMAANDHFAFTSDGHFYVAVENPAGAMGLPMLKFGIVPREGASDSDASESDKAKPESQYWFSPTWLSTKARELASSESESAEARTAKPEPLQGSEQAKQVDSEVTRTPRRPGAKRPEKSFKAEKASASGAPAEVSGGKVTVSCVCMSSWGTTFGVGLMVDPASQPETAGAAGHDPQARPRQQYFIVVLSATFENRQPEPLLVVELDQPPRAMCVNQELVSVLTDKAQQASYASKECVLKTFDVFTGRETASIRNKVVGRTLAIADAGQTRISQREDHRIVVESFDSGEVLAQLRDSKLTFKGTDASGKLLLLETKDTNEAGELLLNLKIKNLDSVEQFGPSQRTTEIWLNDAKQDLPAMQNTLAQHKDGLPHWPLLFTEQWSEFFSRLLDSCVDNRNYGPFKLLIESCPYFWASTRYRGEDGKTVTFWSHVLAINDKTLAQILLEGVIQMVTDRPEIVPVQAMQQVTDFIRESIELNKMSDKVEVFLTHLPLLRVPNKSISGQDEKVSAEFKNGDIMKTSWRTRDAPISATAWSFLCAPETQGGKTSGIAATTQDTRGDVGYRYVSVLPGLTEKSVIAAFVSDKASPTLVDNETMRATIDSLEETTSGKIYFLAWKPRPGRCLPIGIGRYPWDWMLSLYIITLLMYCCLIFFTAIKRPDESFDTLKDTPSGGFGVGAGVLAVIGHVTFLVFEVVELVTVTHGSADKWYDMIVNYFRHASAAWNLIPIVGNSLGIVTYFLVVGSPKDKAGSERDEFIRVLAAFAMIFLWLNLFNYLRAYRKGSALVQMLLQIMVDMLYFVGVVLVLICGFAGGFYALHGKLDPEELGLENENACIDEPENNEFLEVGDAVARTFLMSILGDFDVDSLRNRLDVKVENDGGPRGGLLTNISFLFFFTLVLLVSVVALNALIALMSSTYGRVEQSAQAVTYKAVLTITFDKLRFRYFTRWIQQQTFERITRWTHVLSPSETSSMPQLMGIQGSANPLAALRREFKLSERATHKRLDYMVNALAEVQRGSAEQSEEIAGTKVQLGDLSEHVSDVVGKLSDQMEFANNAQKEQFEKVLSASLSGMVDNINGGLSDQFRQQAEALEDVKSRVGVLAGAHVGTLSQARQV